MLDHRPPHEHGHRLTAMPQRLIQTVLTSLRRSAQPAVRPLAWILLALVTVRDVVHLQPARPRGGTR